MRNIISEYNAYDAPFEILNLNRKRKEKKVTLRIRKTRSSESV